MVKKQTGGKAKASAKKLDIKKFWHAHWVGILIGVLVFGIFAFIGVNKLIIYNQKKQFDAAEASLDALYADIVKEVGQPTSTSKDKSCTYRSVEIGQGERRCGAQYLTNYNEVARPDTANDFKKRIETAINGNPEFMITNTRSTVFSDNVKNNNSQVFDIKLSNNAQYSCYLSVDYIVKDESAIPIISNTHTEVALACYADAKSEFYPVKN